MQPKHEVLAQRRQSRHQLHPTPVAHSPMQHMPGNGPSPQPSAKQARGKGTACVASPGVSKGQGLPVAGACMGGTPPTGPSHEFPQGAAAPAPPASTATHNPCPFTPAGQQFPMTKPGHLSQGEDEPGTAPTTDGGAPASDGHASSTSCGADATIGPTTDHTVSVADMDDPAASKPAAEGHVHTSSPSVAHARGADVVMKDELQDTAPAGPQATAAPAAAGGRNLRSRHASRDTETALGANAAASAGTHTSHDDDKGVQDGQAMDTTKLLSAAQPAALAVAGENKTVSGAPSGGNTGAKSMGSAGGAAARATPAAGSHASRQDRATGMEAIGQEAEDEEEQEEGAESLSDTQGMDESSEEDSSLEDEEDSDSDAAPRRRRRAAVPAPPQGRSARTRPSGRPARGRGRTSGSRSRHRVAPGATLDIGTLATAGPGGGFAPAATSRGRGRGRGGSKRSQRFTGVYNQGYGRWRAQFCHGGLVHQLGMYDTEENAAQAWDRVAWVYRGSVEELNFAELVSEYDAPESRATVHTQMDERMQMRKPRGKAAAAEAAARARAEAQAAGLPQDQPPPRTPHRTGRAGTARKVPNRYIPPVSAQGGVRAMGATHVDTSPRDAFLDGSEGLDHRPSQDEAAAVTAEHADGDEVDTAGGARGVVAVPPPVQAGEDKTAKGEMPEEGEEEEEEEDRTVTEGTEVGGAGPAARHVGADVAVGGIGNGGGTKAVRLPRSRGPVQRKPHSSATEAAMSTDLAPVGHVAALAPAPAAVAVVGPIVTAAHLPHGEDIHEEGPPLMQVQGTDVGAAPTVSTEDEHGGGAAGRPPSRRIAKRKAHAVLHAQTDPLTGQDSTQVSGAGELLRGDASRHPGMWTGTLRGTGRGRDSAAGEAQHGPGAAGAPLGNGFVHGADGNGMGSWPRVAGSGQAQAGWEEWGPPPAKRPVLDLQSGDGTARFQAPAPCPSHQQPSPTSVLPLGPGSHLFSPPPGSAGSALGAGGMWVGYEEEGEEEGDGVGEEEEEEPPFTDPEPKLAMRGAVRGRGGSRGGPGAPRLLGAVPHGLGAIWTSPEKESPDKLDVLGHVAEMVAAGEQEAEALQARRAGGTPRGRTKAHGLKAGKRLFEGSSGDGASGGRGGGGRAGKVGSWGRGKVGPGGHGAMGPGAGSGGGPIAPPVYATWEGGAWEGQVPVGPGSGPAYQQQPMATSQAYPPEGHMNGSGWVSDEWGEEERGSSAHGKAPRGRAGGARGAGRMSAPYPAHGHQGGGRQAGMSAPPAVYGSGGPWAYRYESGPHDRPPQHTSHPTSYVYHHAATGAPQQLAPHGQPLQNSPHQLTYNAQAAWPAAGRAPLPTGQVAVPPAHHMLTPAERARTEELLSRRQPLDRSHQFAEASQFRGVYRQMPEEGGLWACVIEHEERLWLLSVRSTDTAAAQDFDAAVRYYGGPAHYLNFPHWWGYSQPDAQAPPGSGPKHGGGSSSSVSVPPPPQQHRLGAFKGAAGVPVSQYAFGGPGAGGAARPHGNKATAAAPSTKPQVDGTAPVAQGPSEASSHEQAAVDGRGSEGGVPQQPRPMLAPVGTPHSTSQGGHSRVGPAVVTTAMGGAATGASGGQHIGPFVLGTSHGGTTQHFPFLLQHTGTSSHPPGTITIAIPIHAGSNWPATPASSASGGLIGSLGGLGSAGGSLHVSGVMSPEENLARLLMSPGGMASVGVHGTPGDLGSPGQPLGSLGLALSTLEALGAGRGTFAGEALPTGAVTSVHSPAYGGGGARPQLRLIPHFYDHIAAREGAAAVAASAAPTATTSSHDAGEAAVGPPALGPTAPMEHGAHLQQGAHMRGALVPSLGAPGTPPNQHAAVHVVTVPSAVDVSELVGGAPVEAGSAEAGSKADAACPAPCPEAPATNEVQPGSALQLDPTGVKAAATAAAAGAGATAAGDTSAAAQAPRCEDAGTHSEQLSTAQH